MDILGNVLSEHDLPFLEGINDFVSGFLAYDSKSVNILSMVSASDAANFSVIANSYCGFLWMFLEAPEASTKATIFLKLCEDIMLKANELNLENFLRGRIHIEILRMWISDEIPSVLRLVEVSIESYPRDLVLVKIYQYMAFNQGQLTLMLDIVQKVLPYCEDVGYIHGMIAFAYEQCHKFDEAEISAKKALSMVSNEPWAEHALAHVMLSQGRVLEGLNFLETASVHWTKKLNSFMYTHLYWHLALFYICLQNFSRALQIYDNHVWGVAKEYSQDQINAVSLLVRLELAGCQTTGVERWQDLAKYLLVRCEDVTQPFHALHYLIGLQRAGYHSQANQLLQSIQIRCETAPQYLKLAWNHAVRPASLGIMAWLQEPNHDYQAAKLHMKDALNYMQSIGGSNAQRDLFELIYLDIVIKSEDYRLGLQILESRCLKDPQNLTLFKMKDDVQSKLL